MSLATESISGLSMVMVGDPSSRRNDLAWAKQHYATYNKIYSTLQDYYDGRHPIRVSDEVRTSFSKLLGQNIRDNLAPVVCDNLADKIVIRSWVSDSEEDSVWANELWSRLNMDVRSTEVHTDAVVLGDAYVIVWPGDDGLARIYKQRTWDMAVRYEETGEEERIAEAVKAWVLVNPDGTQTLRVNRYLPDRVERYYSSGTIVSFPTSTESLEPFEGDGQPAVIENPFGQVPVFRFANSLRNHIFARGEYTDGIPLQDFLNKTLVDLAVGSEFHGLPQRWATGLTLPRDPVTGEYIKPFRAGADRVWAVGDTQVEFGQFEVADLVQLVQVLDNIRHEIARVTRTPAHLFVTHTTGTYPSGEALKTAEAPLTLKARKRILVWGEVWENVMRFAAAVEGRVLESPLKPIFMDPEARSEEEVLRQATIKKSLGVSTKKLLSEIGYTDDEIALMLMENEEESARRFESAQRALAGGWVE